LPPANFRIGWGTDDQGTVGSWTAWMAVPTDQLRL